MNEKQKKLAAQLERVRELIWNISMRIRNF